MKLIDAFREEILKLESALPVLAKLAEAASPQGEDADFLVAERPLALADIREAVEALHALTTVLDSANETNDNTAHRPARLPRAANDGSSSR